MLLSVVIPCYNSQNTIRKVVELTREVTASMEGLEVEFILVDDYSPDGTREEIWKLAQDYPEVKGLHLSRSFLLLP